MQYPRLLKIILKTPSRHLADKITNPLIIYQTKKYKHKLRVVQKTRKEAIRKISKNVNLKYTKSLIHLLINLFTKRNVI